MTMFELVDNSGEAGAVIRVLGVGGGGGNAVEHMVANSIEGVDFICANTDAQALAKSSASTVLQLGQTVTKGLGAGANPDIGRQSALEDRDRIAEALDGTDMLFITAGMGGGTGTGAAPVIAQIAKELDILTVAVVTKPFPFEMRRRSLLADEGIKDLSEYVDSLITVPNERLLSVLGGRVTLREAFRAANDVLLGAVQGIAELITRPGEINVDFADVRTVMSEKGRAMMGSGRATGEDRARHAAERAINCPLLEDVNLRGARGILVNVTAGPDLGMDEFAAVGDAIGEFASDDALVVMGTAFDENVQDELRVTVVATGVGIGASQQSHVPMAAAQRPTGRRTVRDEDGGLRLVDDHAQGRVQHANGQQPLPDYGADTATDGYLNSYVVDPGQQGMAHGAPVQQQPGYAQPPAAGQGHRLSYPPMHAQPQPQQLQPTMPPPVAGAPQPPQDYGRFETPTVSRRQPPRAQGNLATASQEELEYLDIPAFLRKQAD